MQVYKQVVSSSPFKKASMPGIASLRNNRALENKVEANPIVANPKANSSIVGMTTLTPNVLGPIEQDLNHLDFYLLDMYKGGSQTDLKRNNLSFGEISVPYNTTNITNEQGLGPTNPVVTALRNEKPHPIVASSMFMSYLSLGSKSKGLVNEQMNGKFIYTSDSPLHVFAATLNTQGAPQTTFDKFGPNTPTAGDMTRSSTMHSPAVENKTTAAMNDVKIHFLAYVNESGKQFIRIKVDGKLNMRSAQAMKTSAGTPHSASFDFPVEVFDYSNIDTPYPQESGTPRTIRDVLRGFAEVPTKETIVNPNSAEPFSRGKTDDELYKDLLETYITTPNTEMGATVRPVFAGFPGSQKGKVAFAEHAYAQYASMLGKSLGNKKLAADLQERYLDRATNPKEASSYAAAIIALTPYSMDPILSYGQTVLDMSQKHNLAMYQHALNLRKRNKRLMGQDMIAQGTEFGDKTFTRGTWSGDRLDYNLPTKVNMVDLANTDATTTLPHDAVDPANQYMKGFIDTAALATNADGKKTFSYASTNVPDPRMVRAYSLSGLKESFAAKGIQDLPVLKSKDGTPLGLRAILVDLAMQQGGQPPIDIKYSLDENTGDVHIANHLSKYYEQNVVPRYPHLNRAAGLFAMFANKDFERGFVNIDKVLQSKGVSMLDLQSTDVVKQEKARQATTDFYLDLIADISNLTPHDAAAMKKEFYAGNQYKDAKVQLQLAMLKQLSNSTYDDYYNMYLRGDVYQKPLVNDALISTLVNTYYALKNYNRVKKPLTKIGYQLKRFGWLNYDTPMFLAKFDPQKGIGYSAINIKSANRDGFDYGRIIDLFTLTDKGGFDNNGLKLNEIDILRGTSLHIGNEGGIEGFTLAEEQMAAIVSVNDWIQNMADTMQQHAKNIFSSPTYTSKIMSDDDRRSMQVLGSRMSSRFGTILNKINMFDSLPGNGKISINNRAKHDGTLEPEIVYSDNGLSIVVSQDTIGKIDKLASHLADRAMRVGDKFPEFSGLSRETLSAGIELALREKLLYNGYMANNAKQIAKTFATYAIRHQVIGDREQLHKYTVQQANMLATRYNTMASQLSLTGDSSADINALNTSYHVFNSETQTRSNIEKSLHYLAEKLLTNPNAMLTKLERNNFYTITKMFGLSTKVSSNAPNSVRNKMMVDNIQKALDIIKAANPEDAYYQQFAKNLSYMQNKVHNKVLTMKKFNKAQQQSAGDGLVLMDTNIDYGYDTAMSPSAYDTIINEFTSSLSSSFSHIMEQTYNTKSKLRHKNGMEADPIIQREIQSQFAKWRNEEFVYNVEYDPAANYDGYIGTQIKIHKAGAFDTKFLHGTFVGKDKDYLYLLHKGKVESIPLAKIESGLLSTPIGSIEKKSRDIYSTAFRKVAPDIMSSYQSMMNGTGYEAHRAEIYSLTQQIQHMLDTRQKGIAELVQENASKIVVGMEYLQLGKVAMASLELAGAVLSIPVAPTLSGALFTKAMSNYAKVGMNLVRRLTGNYGSAIRHGLTHIGFDAMHELINNLSKEKLIAEANIRTGYAKTFTGNELSLMSDVNVAGVQSTSTKALRDTRRRIKTLNTQAQVVWNSGNFSNLSAEDYHDLVQHALEIGVPRSQTTTAADLELALKQHYPSTDQTIDGHDLASLLVLRKKLRAQALQDMGGLLSLVTKSESQSRAISQNIASSIISKDDPSGALTNTQLSLIANAMADISVGQYGQRTRLYDDTTPFGRIMKMYSRFNKNNSVWHLKEAWGQMNRQQTLQKLAVTTNGQFSGRGTAVNNTVMLTPDYVKSQSAYFDLGLSTAMLNNMTAMAGAALLALLVGDEDGTATGNVSVTQDLVRELGTWTGFDVASRQLFRSMFMVGGAAMSLSLAEDEILTQQIMQGKLDPGQVAKLMSQAAQSPGDFLYSLGLGKTPTAVANGFVTFLTNMGIYMTQNNKRSRAFDFKMDEETKKTAGFVLEQLLASAPQTSFMVQPAKVIAEPLSMAVNYANTDTRLERKRSDIKEVETKPTTIGQTIVNKVVGDPSKKDEKRAERETKKIARNKRRNKKREDRE
jgi:hypothetical protein